MPWQKIGIVLGIIVALITVGSTSAAWFGKLATDKEVEAVRELVVMNTQTIKLTNQRLEQNIVEDKVYGLKKRVAEMEKLYGLPMPTAQMMQYMDLKNDLEKEQRKLNLIYKD